jgi:hypothetical protein
VNGLDAGTAGEIARGDGPGAAGATGLIAGEGVASGRRAGSAGRFAGALTWANETMPGRGATRLSRRFRLRAACAAWGTVGGLATAEGEDFCRGVRLAGLGALDVATIHVTNTAATAPAIGQQARISRRAPRGPSTMARAYRSPSSAAVVRSYLRRRTGSVSTLWISLSRFIWHSASRRRRASCCWSGCRSLTSPRQASRTSSGEAFGVSPSSS